MLCDDSDTDVMMWCDDSDEWSDKWFDKWFDEWWEVKREREKQEDVLDLSLYDLRVFAFLWIYWKWIIGFMVMKLICQESLFDIHHFIEYVYGYGYTTKEKYSYQWLYIFKKTFYIKFRNNVLLQYFVYYFKRYKKWK